MGDEQRKSTAGTGASGAPDAPVLQSVAPGAAVGHESGRDYVPEDPRGEDGIPRCWELRGCAGTFGFLDYMEAECPHNIEGRYSPCPATCAYTRCQRPWHVEATALEDLLDPHVDRLATIKEQCRHCMHFIKNGPRAVRVS